MRRRRTGGALAVLAAVGTLVVLAAPHADAVPTRASDADLTMRGDGAVLARHLPGDPVASRAADAPGRPQVTVTLRLVLPDGVVPLSIAATVVNADDANSYGTTFGMSGDSQQLSLPTGTYSVLVLAMSKDRATNRFVLRVAFAVDQHLTADGQTMRVDLTAAQRTAYPSYDAAPDAKTIRDVQFYAVEDGTGANPGGTWVIPTSPRSDVYAAPSAGGEHGRLVSMNETIQQGAGPGSPLYFLTWAHRNAVVPDEQVSVDPAELTRVVRHYYSDGTASHGSAGRLAVYPYFDSGVITPVPTPVPAVRDEYLFAPRGVVWFNDVEVSTNGGGSAGMLGFTSYSRGATVREDVWRGPLAPGVAVQPAGARTYPADGPRTCWVCRTGDGMSVGLSPVVGSQPNLGAALYSWPGQRPYETRLTVSRDGTTLYSGTNAGAASIDWTPARIDDVPAGMHSYRISETTDRAADGMATSTLATTTYAFSSSARSGAALDSSWTCGAYGFGTCTVLPLLAVRMPLPTSLTSTLPGGYSFLIADVGHVQGAAPTPITGLTVSIRSGASAWQKQTVESLGGGRYYVAIRNTAPRGTAVSMRWQATDAAGSSVTQTVRDAYRVAGS